MASNLLEDADLALSKLINLEVELVKETELLFKSQVDQIRNIDQLEAYRPDMAKLDMYTKQLSTLVDQSSALVQDVCGKFSRIDLAKARLQDCLAKINDIHDLRSCRDGVQNAMNTANYEEAAMHIKRFLAIDQAELHKTIAIICGQDMAKGQLFAKNFTEPTRPNEDEEFSLEPKFMNLCLNELAEARGRLLALCQENIAKAIEADNIKDVERYFKIFPMLNEHQDGLFRYAGYLKSKIVNQQVSKSLESSQVDQADKLAALYESIAKIIDAHQPLIETYYGPGHLITIVKPIQKECDRLSRKILEEFRNKANLQFVARTINSSLQLMGQIFSASSGANKNSQLNLTTCKTLDARNLDGSLNEISSIISRTEIYLNFIVKRISDDMNFKYDNEEQRKSSMAEVYNLIRIECELNYLKEEVGSIYVMMETFYLNESSIKAIQVDQIDVESSTCYTSSMLDDIFFIIKKCTKRAISTKSIDVFCAVINHCVTLLESLFCQVLIERLKNQPSFNSAFQNAKNLDLSQATYSAIQSVRYLQNSNEVETTRAQYFSALNNLDKASSYIQTLKQILETDVKRLKPSLLKPEKNQLQNSISCLNELSQLVSKFSSVINSSLYQLFNSSLKSRLRTELKTVVTDNIDLLPEITSNPNQLARLASDLLLIVDRTLQTSLTPDNYSKLVSITKENLIPFLKSDKWTCHCDEINYNLSDACIDETANYCCIREYKSVEPFA